MKKISAILVCLLLVLSMTVTAFAATTVNLSLTADKASANRGDVVKFTVSIPEVANFRSASVTVNFDTDVFAFVSGECVLDDYAIQSVDLLSDGVVNGVCAFATEDHPAAASGALFTIKLKVLDAAALEKTTVSIAADSVVRIFNAANATVQAGKADVNVICTQHNIIKGMCTICGHVEFPDVKTNAWYHDAVVFAVKRGYFTGHDSGEFKPTDPISRQDFVLVLSRIAGADMTQYTGQTAFTDVKPNAYYAKAIQWATENGIIGGYNPTTFGVGDKLTREQLVTIMYRYAKKLGVDVTVTTGWDKMSEYPDATAPNPNLREMVAWALEKGIISGKQVDGKTCIAPQLSATRAETAQILLNISTKGLIPGI